MLPSPTAEPMAAMMKTILVLNVSRVARAPELVVLSPAGACGEVMVACFQSDSDVRATGPSSELPHIWCG